MRNTVEIIHGAIQRIDDPLMIAGLIPHGTFFAVNRVGGKFVEKQFADQMLRLNIDLQFDVVRCDGVDVLPLLKILAKQLSRHARGIFSRIEITLHQKVEWLMVEKLSRARRQPQDSCSTQRLNLSTSHKKKTGRKIYSPPGLKLGVVTPKKFGAVSPALGLMPLFLR